MPTCISNEAPDKHIEEVWYGIKTAIQNTYIGTNIPIPIDLEDISSHLNILQSNQNYQEIEKQIVITIGQICRFYVEHRMSVYNCHILDVQIKRWNKVTEKYKFFEKQDIRNVIENCVFFYIYFKIFENYKKYTALVELFNNTDNMPEINKIIDISVKYNYPTILDKANNFFCVSTYINNKYETKFFKNTNGNKLISHLVSKKLLNL
tara:strand:- start:2304 stop:2924 length:621 start_codon:yes stop_codon:yes gene_type:complete